MTELNSHLIEYTDPDKGPSMISIRQIEDVRQSKAGAVIDAGILLLATESAKEIIERIHRLQEAEMTKIDR